MLHSAVPRRWLVFVHQLPAHPSNGRVKIWRRLQQVGAIALKNAVHVLPNSRSRSRISNGCGGGGRARWRGVIFKVSSMSEADERYILVN